MQQQHKRSSDTSGHTTDGCARQEPGSKNWYQSGLESCEEYVCIVWQLHTNSKEKTSNAPRGCRDISTSIERCVFYPHRFYRAGDSMAIGA